MSSNNNKKLFVGNIPKSSNSEDLDGIFGRFGKLRSVDIMPSGTFAYVEFESEANAQEAISGLSGYVLGGRSLKVEIAKPKRGNNRDSRPYDRPRDDRREQRHRDDRYEQDVRSSYRRDTRPDDRDSRNRNRDRYDRRDRDDRRYDRRDDRKGDRRDDRRDDRRGPRRDDRSRGSSWSNSGDFNTTNDGKEPTWKVSDQPINGFGEGGGWIDAKPSIDNAWGPVETARN